MNSTLTLYLRLIILVTFFVGEGDEQNNVKIAYELIPLRVLRTLEFRSRKYLYYY